MTRGEKAANDYVQSARNGWSELVLLAKDTHPRNIEKSAKSIATAAGTGWHGVKEKMEAIQHAFRVGRDEEFVMNRGQKQTIADFRKAREEKRLDTYVNMGWKVTPDTKFAVKTEILRHCKVMGMRDSETYFTWLHAEMCQWTPAQLRHSAGMPILKKMKET
jgi:hypothetical protein